MNIDFNLLTRESHVNAQYCCEASDIGLRAGQWPRIVYVQDAPIGNGPLQLVNVSAEGTHTYKNFQLTLRIFND